MAQQATSRFFRCRSCKRKLGGEYEVVEGRLSIPLPPVTIAHYLPASARGWPGTGLTLVQYGDNGLTVPMGKWYVRLRCKCGRNEKFTLAKFSATEVDGEFFV